MTDTIEWLETIGKSAKLRHAPAEELAHTLEQTDASDTLKAAVIQGDSALLSSEFGVKLMRTDDSSHTHPHPPHHPHHPYKEGEEEKEKEQPDHQEDEPGQSKP
jgi:hypothetical protein